MSKDNQPVEQQNKTAVRFLAEYVGIDVSYLSNKNRIIQAMQAYAAQQHAHTIQVIENRIAELEKKITTPNGFQKTWLTQRQHELKELLTLIKP